MAVITALVNGVKSNTLSIADRAVLYGDSVFETVAVSKQKPLLLEDHLARLELGAQALKIHYNKIKLIKEINSLISLSKVNSVMRITISRGEGGRGYQPNKQMKGTRIISLHDMPSGVKKRQTEGIILGLSSIKLSQQPALAGHKHSNRLEQVLASIEISEKTDEVIMLDSENNVICGSKSNIFILLNGTWVTPRLLKAGIAGVMRGKIMTLLKENNIPFNEHKTLTLKEVKNAEALFVSNSLIGLWPVRQFIAQPFAIGSCQPILHLLKKSGCML